MMSLFKRLAKKTIHLIGLNTLGLGREEHAQGVQRAANIKKLSSFTLSSPDRINSLMNLADYCNNNRIAGDFVECGTYKGGSAAVLSMCMGEGRHIWLYDSFKGMPETIDKDGQDAAKYIGECAATVSDVKEAMRTISVSNDKYSIFEGWFEDTFKAENLPEKVALLHCDADWYNSVTLVLNAFYDRIPNGGVIILDDFGYWEGCREAFYDFCSIRGIKPLLERVGSTQAYWIKGKEANR
jgi:O-methyltransferase